MPMRFIILDQAGQQSLVSSALGVLFCKSSSIYWQGHKAEAKCRGLEGLPNLSSKIQSNLLLRKSFPHFCKYLNNSCSDRP